jgi:serine/threonine-protein kinase
VRIASAIEHPNVTQIFDLGEQEGLLYTVMEWVDGESLAKIYRLAKKKGVLLPTGVALRIIADTCAGLHAAHELCDSGDNRLGVVHRDVSPQNVLVTTGGTVKVIDFGVAKATNRRGAATESGVIKGKIRYMAPEQVRGAAIDHRADVWSVGMCLYELVTGRPPYDELSDIDVVRELMGEHPRPRMDDIPDELLGIFQKTLVLDPKARYATAAEMRRAIEGVIDRDELAASSDDVADFVKTTLPDLAKKRRETVTRGIEEAKHRAAQNPESGRALGGPLPADDVAFAPTLASTRRSAPPPTRVDRPKKLGATGSTRDKTTGGATLSEQVGERPQTSAVPYFVTAVVIGLIVWIVGLGGGAKLRAWGVPWPASAASDAPQATPMPSASASAAYSAPDNAADAAAPPPAASAGVTDAAVLELATDAGARDVAKKHLKWPAAHKDSEVDAGPRRPWNYKPDPLPEATTDPEPPSPAN